jgi:hypothetical protein
VDVRTGAARALWCIEHQSKEAAPVLVAVWRDRLHPLLPESHRLRMVETLGEMAKQDKSVVPVLVEIARFGTYRFSQKAAKILQRVDPKSAADAGIR